MVNLKSIRHIFIFNVIIVIVMLMFATNICAQEPISYNGIQVIGDYDQILDLRIEGGPVFDVENIGPGDEWISTIHFENKNPKLHSMVIKITDVKNDIEDTKMFNIIDAVIFKNNELIFSGKYNEIKSEIEKYSFKDEDQLTMHFSLPIECKNEYQNQVLDSTWVFTCKYTKPTNTGDFYNLEFYMMMGFTSLAMLYFLRKKTYAYEKEE